MRRGWHNPPLAAKRLSAPGRIREQANITFSAGRRFNSNRQHEKIPCDGFAFSMKRPWHALGPTLLGHNRCRFRVRAPHVSSGRSRVDTRPGKPAGKGN